MNFKEWMKKIEKDNKAFKKANKARKRVMIAKDVINALSAKLFDASGRSGYLTAKDFPSVDQGHEYHDKLYVSKDDVRDLLIKTAPSCDVCAKGAIFTCTVMRRDSLKCEDVSFDDLSHMLGGIFSSDQLYLIESCYEHGRLGFGYKDYQFADYPAGKSRLIAIMKNIIKYKGTFRPEMEG